MFLTDRVWHRGNLSWVKFLFIKNIRSMNYYRKSRNYELFIRKVYNCDKGKKYGADEALFMGLYLNEIQTEKVWYRIPPERQFFKVKMYIEKALITLRKRKKYVGSHDHFMPLLLRLQNAISVNDLAMIVSASIVKMIELDNKLRGVVSEVQRK